MKKVLLHVCCGVCAGWPVEKLRQEGNEVTCYFYNPNIFPRDEYDRRLGAARAAADISGCSFIEGPYDHQAWHESVAGMERHAEGGARCAVCFRFRLSRAREMAQKDSFDFFATTLTVSSHKNALLVNAIGTSLSPHAFLAFDFKKQDGFKKTSDFARTHCLYRQDYCGCLFSKKV